MPRPANFPPPTEREALLEACCADLDDVTARLVYADKIEEEGESARARFVRSSCRVYEAQQALEGENACEKAWLLKADPDYLFWIDWLEKGSADRELESLTGRPFLGMPTKPVWERFSYPEDIGLTRAVYARGFIDHLTIPLSVWERSHPNLGRLPIRTVTLTGERPRDRRRAHGRLHGHVQLPAARPPDEHRPHLRRGHAHGRVGSGQGDPRMLPGAQGVEAHRVHVGGAGMCEVERDARADHSKQEAHSK
jgi:uncharacterized protein (TIGR02996 family)